MSDPVDDVFAALANATRRDLLRLLNDGPLAVQELAAHFPVRRPSISGHLRVLRNAGLVTEGRRGRHRYYELEPTGFHNVEEWLAPYERFWRDKLTDLRSLLDGGIED